MSNAQFYDRHWKSLPAEVLLALIHLVLPTVHGPLEPWQTEVVVAPVQRMDNVFLVWLGTIRILLHLEYQSTIDRHMPKRIYDYDTDLEKVAQAQIDPDIHVVSLVIWTRPGKTPKPQWHVEEAGLVLAHKDYHEVHLAEMDWQHVPPQLLVLAPYFQSVTQAQLIPVATQMLREAPPAHQLELAVAFLALTKQQFGDLPEVVQAILTQVGKTMDEILIAIERSDIGVALLEKGQAIGKAEGKAEGEVLGEAAARQRMLGRLWRKHFQAELDAAYLAKVATLPVGRFDGFYDGIADGTFTLAQALAWLDAE